MKEQASALDALQRRLGHNFRDPALLALALTHPAAAEAEAEATGNNQRLEFLGDAILQAVLSHELYQLFPDDREGDLTTKRSLLVRGSSLAALARSLDLGPNLITSRRGSTPKPQPGEEEGTTSPATKAESIRHDPAQTDSANEDALEALIGAVFLDAGPTAARRVIHRLFGDLADRLRHLTSADNPKGRLQELVQPLHGNDALAYVVTATRGRPHDREFEIEVRLHGHTLGKGTGLSKKEAGEDAARRALERWSDEQTARAEIAALTAG
ncbi:MAG: ribonuclease III [Puniceicoccaceae bacterium]|nr:MAG: ribonuclease III [Puniceicoccaceae bacterium]